MLQLVLVVTKYQITQALSNLQFRVDNLFVTFAFGCTLGHDPQRNRRLADRDSDVGCRPRRIMSGNMASKSLSPTPKQFIV